MKLVPSKTPSFVKSLFPNFIWNIDTQKQELFLTFDDGPTPEITPWVLEQLKQYNAKATFFCIGSNIEKHPEIFNQIIAEGHSIGNHTYNHLKGWKHKTKTYLSDVEKTQNVINPKIQRLNSKEPNTKNFVSERECHSERSRSAYETGNSKSLKENGWNLKFNPLEFNLFRPPYGKLNTKQAKKLQKLGYKIIMWDVLSFDWDAKISEKDCYNNIINSAKKGSIIVMHDSVKAERNLKAVLPKVLEYYTKRGFVFNKLS